MKHLCRGIIKIWCSKNLVETNLFWYLGHGVSRSAKSRTTEFALDCHIDGSRLVASDLVIFDLDLRSTQTSLLPYFRNLWRSRGETLCLNPLLPILLPLPCPPLSYYTILQVPTTDLNQPLQDQHNLATTNETTPPSSTLRIGKFSQSALLSLCIAHHLPKYISEPHGNQTSDLRTLSHTFTRLSHLVRLLSFLS